MQIGFRVFGVHLYCEVFVDHFTRHFWVYMPKGKSEIPDIVKQFAADTALIHKDYPLRCLRRDHAGEHISQVLEALGNGRRAYIPRGRLHMNYGKTARLRIILRLCAI
jgi:hypothetical protein